MKTPFLRSKAIPFLFALILLYTGPRTNAELPAVRSVDAQPLQAQTRRLVKAMEYLGAPLSQELRNELDAAFAGEDPGKIAETVQGLLDPLCLMGVVINPESRVKAAAGPADPVLTEHGWTVFLVKVANQAGVTARMRADSPNAESMHNSPRNELRDRWLDLALFDSQPLNPDLSGLELEYRIIQLYSRDSGKREAKFMFDVGQGTQDLGFRNEANILFQCRAANEIALRVLDESGEPATAEFLIRDLQGRVYPSQSKRTAPDFAFHPQVYRSHGDIEKLPSGTYTIRFARGPESIPQTRTVSIDSNTKSLNFQVKRWIDPSKTGWWSGDHHIHAAGCAHYTNPSEGVHAVDMMRHCLGEDLKIGANLTWGPCFDYQKQFFTGVVDPVSRYPYLLRYDVEVSGFGSHRSGHLCLLRLRDQIYPGGDSKDHWPTLCLNTLKWAQKQGAVCGPAHSGWGLQVDTDELPNYVIPPYDGIGANEYIVDVTHMVEGAEGKPVPAVDFISTVDTPYVWELNIWYHTLNCGYRTRISGETDFPCIYGERVGLGRSYVKLDGRLDYDDWCAGIEQGRNYVSDGRSHLLEFQVNRVKMGENNSVLNLDAPSRVQVTAKAAAYLPETPERGIRNRPYQQKPYWHVERARKGDSRKVDVELIVNGYPVERREIVADGGLQDLKFETQVDHSSWIALRILPSSHTNPVFVLVDGKPVRASRRSAEWCLKGVNQCWTQKERHISEREMNDARLAYDHARAAYERILSESVAD